MISKRSKILGRGIKTARRMVGMTQKELAVAAGGDDSKFISRVERGLVEISSKLERKLIRATKVPRDVVLFLATPIEAFPAHHRKNVMRMQRSILKEGDLWRPDRGR